MKRSVGSAFACVAAINFVLSNDAHAYLDPGTGSMILQMLAAGFLGGLYTVKVYWAHVSNFFRNLVGSTPGSNDQNGE